MRKKNSNLILSLLFVLMIVFVSVGSTYSFLRIYTNNTTVVNGQSYDFNVALNIDVINSGDLIPTADNLISQSLNSQNVCLDRRGYGLCSLYRMTITNSGSAQTLNGYIKTLAATTYTTDNLKYQLYTFNNSTYTAISDASTLSHTSNSINYFKLNSNNISFSIADGSTTSQSIQYYLVIWLSDTGSNQPSDISKQFVGDLIFTSKSGGSLTSQFTS